MNPVPTGRLLRTDVGRDLVLERTFRAPIEDVWASITESDRTARWFGRWSGEAGVGKTVQYAMTLEEGEPTGEMTIEACEPPRRLAVKATDASGGWRLEARLSERDGMTHMEFIHHLTDDIGVGSVGPGWEYYLDALVASRDGTKMPDFNDYYPSQKAYYQAQEAASS